VDGNVEIVDAGQQHIAAAIMSADIFCGHAKVPVDWPSVVAQGTLKWIQSSAAGLDHCLVPEVIASRIVVSSASGVFAPQVAEHAIALILALLRSLPKFFRAQQQRDYTRRPTGDLRGKTVGIVGFGGNGRRLAEVLAPFDVTIVATDTFPEDRPAWVKSLWPATELPRLLQVSDIVVLCLPLNEATTQLLSQREFDQCRPGALLINVARGGVVQERALVAALQSGKLAGAGLDVAEVEPLPADNPLWGLPQVIITPHVGAQAADRIDRTTDLFCANLRRYFTGQPLINLVDKQLGYPRPANRVDPSAWHRESAD
jgi:D-3-phosphoglycerate dehydrogenase